MASIETVSDFNLSPLPLPDLRRLNARRLILLVPSACLATAIIALAVSMLASQPRHVLDWVLLLPFALVMSWECLIVWQLVLGFWVWLQGKEGHSPLERAAATIEPRYTGHSKTALLVPIFEEDIGGVLTRVQVMLHSLAEFGRCDDITVHLLSDTQDPALAAMEQTAFEAFASDMPPIAVSYRRRAANLGRKAGNILDFLDDGGRSYDFSIVLDADSLMSGAAMRRLICLMEQHPRIGLIQTVSYATGHTTLFARMQQFAVKLYAPLALHGLQFWQGPEGSYWGHNAILRVSPFRVHCRLPILPGRPPLGGEILCHDVVEGAFLARAGWEVHLIPEMEGTWEEMPTNALDLIGRERRWCQGNLQHLRVLGLPGLKLASRAHLALGIGGYLVAPLWWLFLVVGALRVALAPDHASYGLLAFGLTESGLAAITLAAASILLMVLPRALNVIRAVSEPRTRTSFGGFGRLLLSAAIEQGFWILFGPLLSLIVSSFVVKTLLGQSVSWERQVRNDRLVPFREALHKQGWTIVLGACLGSVATQVSGLYAIWMLPTILGLMIGPLMTSISSRSDLGGFFRRRKLFVTVDETSCAPELISLYSNSKI